MNMSKLHFLPIVVMLSLGLVACGSGQPALPDSVPTQEDDPTKTPRPTVVLTTADSPDTPEPTPTALPDTPNPTAPGSYGPTDFPENINPLTGLEVEDPDILLRRPIVVKVSNESPDVRPQSGLSFADHVWEYQMEGWGQTRFSAVYLAQAPERVGSVRSARLIDSEVLVPMYDGLFVMSGTSLGMGYILTNKPWWNRVFREDPEEKHLVRIPNIPREGTQFYHSLFAVLDDVWRQAKDLDLYEREKSLDGLLFNEAVPDGGIPTEEAVVDFPRAGALHRWRYDESSGKWLSSTEDQRAVTLEQPDTDMLTGKRLAFDNVIFIYVEHYLADYIEDEPNQLLAVGINLEGEGQAFIMRDGYRYEATWRREDDNMIQFFDEDDNLIPLKPGNIWFTTSDLPDAEYPAEFSFSP